MDFDDTPEQAAFRKEVRSWIAENAPKQEVARLDKESFVRLDFKGDEKMALCKSWQQKKFDAGWACLHWPKDYGGRGATPMERVIWQQEEGFYAYLGYLFIIGQGMCGPTLMAYATEAQKRRYLPKIASGEEIWCQLFSEPSAGSDLAGLRTRAEKEGDEWVINGQKIWTSGAQISQFAILITRTDPTAPKHKGLTMFFLDMNTPGVEVRPIKQINGESSFNEVFFTDVRVSDSQRLGALNDGWKVSLTTLMNERLSLGAGVKTGFPELLEFCRNTRGPLGESLLNDRAVQSRLADFATRHSGLKYTSMRATSAISRGETPGPENSISKLVAGACMQEIAMFAFDLQGASGAIADNSLATYDDVFQTMLLRAPGVRVEGGTDEILRNIIAERVLGLPPDTRVDKDVPFNKISTHA